MTLTFDEGEKIPGSLIMFRKLAKQSVDSVTEQSEDNLLFFLARCAEKSETRSFYSKDGLLMNTSYLFAYIALHEMGLIKLPKKLDGQPIPLTEEGKAVYNTLKREGIFKKLDKQD